MSNKVMALRLGFYLLESLNNDNGDGYKNVT